MKDKKILRTDLDGAVKITDSQEGLSIKTYRDFRFEENRDLSWSKEMRNIRRLFQIW